MLLTLPFWKMYFQKSYCLTLIQSSQNLNLLFLSDNLVIDNNYLTFSPVRNSISLKVTKVRIHGELPLFNCTFYIMNSYFDLERQVTEYLYHMPTHGVVVYKRFIGVLHVSIRWVFCSCLKISKGSPRK